jgi:hypothetical protein
MTTAIIRIEKCIQDVQNVSGNADESAMLSQVYFQLEVEDRVSSGLVVQISQPYGCDYASEPIEVGPPQGYNGPFNHEEFSEKVEQYYRSLVGDSGRGISFSGGGNIRMRNNTFVMSAEFTSEIGQGTEGGW